MSGSRCFLIGHRMVSDEIKEILAQTVETHIIQYGVTEFMVGTYGGFDHMAAQVLVSAKKIYSDISLTMLLPYHPSEKHVSVPDGFDNTCYPENQENVPKRVAIVRANHYAVDHSDFLIAYVWQAASNARNILEYAQQRSEQRELHITVLPHRNYFE